MEFITKTYKGGRNGQRISDVYFSITKSKKANGTYRCSLVLSFSEKSKNIIFGESEYGKIAFDNDRLYFCCAEKREGYKLSAKTGGHIYVMSISVTERLKKYSYQPWIGDYIIRFDREEKLWYISLDDKLA